MSDFVISQILIGFAFCFDVASFQLRDKNRILLCLTCATCLIAAHFWLLGAMTAAVVAAICALRFLTAIITKSFWMMLFFLALIVASAYVTYGGVLTVLVTTASCLSTWGAFRASDKVFRLIMMVTAVLMMAHNGLPVRRLAYCWKSFSLAATCWPIIVITLGVDDRIVWREFG